MTKLRLVRTDSDPPDPGGRTNAREQDDDELMAAIAGGSAAACAHLVDRHLPRIVNLAARMLGDTAEAQDVAQEVFLRVWRKAGKWQAGRARLTTWLHRVTLNLCIDRKRRRSTITLDAISEPIDPAPSADSLIVARQSAARVQQALLALPERQRAAILLCHHEGHSNIDAAHILAISVDALEQLLSRGRTGLRRLLASDFLELLRDS